MSLETWNEGVGYESYIGRWSRLVAREFVNWLALPTRARWLDVGCGTGALSAAILEGADPQELRGLDRSEEYARFAEARLGSARARFDVGDATLLPLESGRFDVTVSGLMLNFIPEPARALHELVRVTRSGGTVAVYLWDYSEGMQLIRHFWDAATRLDPSAQALDEARRFPLCAPDPLERLFTDAGLGSVGVSAIEVPTVFSDFDDYWSPFMSGQGPAPNYAASLPESKRMELRDATRRALALRSDGSIALVARAWAAKGIKS